MLFKCMDGIMFYLIIITIITLKIEKIISQKGMFSHKVFIL